MNVCLLLYSAGMTVTLLSTSIYCFVVGSSSTGIAVLTIFLFSCMFTVNIAMRIKRERAIRAMLERIEIVVVPGMRIGGREYPFGIPKETRVQPV